MQTTREPEPLVTLLRWEGTPRAVPHTATAAEHAAWRLPEGERFTLTSWFVDDNGYEYGSETVEISRGAALGLLTQAIADGADPDWARFKSVYLLDPHIFGTKPWWDRTTLRPVD